MTHPATPTSASRYKRAGRRPAAWALVLPIVPALFLGSCGGTSKAATATAGPEGAGLTLVGSSASYIVLFNVVDPERM